MKTYRTPRLRGARTIGACRHLLAGTALTAGLLAGLGDAAPASAGEFRLLEFDGVAVKWGEMRLGTGARVTWALQEDERHDPDAINCRHTRGLDPLLTKAGVSAEAFRAQAAVAFAMWQAATGLTFVPAAPGEAADIVIGAQIAPHGIAWTNVDFALPPEEVVFAAEVAPPVARPVAPLTSAAICLNPQAPWRIGFDGNLATYDLRHVLAHEIGHAIGLDHPGKTGQLMGFAYQENLPDLTAGDVSGAVLLYGPRMAPRAGLTARAGAPLSNPYGVR